MKRSISLLLCLALLAGVFAGCATAPAPSQASQAPASEAAPAPSEDAAPAEEPAAQAEASVPTGDKPIALLIPSPVGDPFIALCVKGLEKLSAETGAELKIIETLDKAEYEDQVRAMAELGANPVYCMWGDLSELAVKVAPEYPDTKFILADVYMKTNEPNVSSISVDPYASSFIAGYLAANTTEAKKVGFIAHADRPVSRRYRDGFIAGVHHVDENIPVEVAYVGNDQDPVKGQEVAKLMIQNNGVDLIFQSASRSGLGVIAGCADQGIKCIGSDDYQGDVDPCVFWSALKPFDEALYVEGKSVFDGTYESGDKAYGLAQGLPMYDQRNFDKLPKELQDGVLEIVEGIKNGTIQVTEDENVVK